MNKIDIDHRDDSKELASLNINALPANDAYELENRRQLVCRLRQSPMFQLSLSSKELFHSNFLYWIWMVSPVMFKEVINELYKGIDKRFQIESWPIGFVVTREHKHFDLCVIENQDNGKDKILLVIENKVKSIPYKSQLDAYVEKSSNADHLLLSLIGNDFPEYDEIIKTWTTFSYGDLAIVLSNIAGDKCGYVYDIIRDYVSYISILDCFAKEWKKNGKTSSKEYKYKDEIYQGLRIADIYQKILFSQILSQIIDTLKNSSIEFNWNHVFNDANSSRFGANTLYVNSGLTNSTGFLEVKVKIEQDIAILVQVQGDQYRRCIEFNNKKEKKWSSLEDNIKWLRENAPAQIKQLFAFEEGKPPKIPYPGSIGTDSPFIKYKRNDPNGIKTQNGFCKYGNCFIYQYHKINNKLIDDIVKAVVDDVMEFRSIVSTKTAE